HGIVWTLLQIFRILLPRLRLVLIGFCVAAFIFDWRRLILLRISLVIGVVLSTRIAALFPRFCGVNDRNELVRSLGFVRIRIFVVFGGRPIFHHVAGLELELARIELIFADALPDVLFIQ